MDSLEEIDKDKKENNKKKYMINLENNKKISSPPPIMRQFAFQKSILDIKTINFIIDNFKK